MWQCVVTKSDYISQPLLDHSIYINLLSTVSESCSYLMRSILTLHTLCKWRCCIWILHSVVLPSLWLGERHSLQLTGWCVLSLLIQQNSELINLAFDSISSWLVLVLANVMRGSYQIKPNALCVRLTKNWVPSLRLELETQAWHPNLSPNLRLKLGIQAWETQVLCFQISYDTDLGQNLLLGWRSKLVWQTLMQLQF